MSTIIIAEKPDAAERIARALAEKDLKRRESRYGVAYWEFQRKNKKHIVIAAVGHLFTLKQKTKGWEYPVFIKSIDWMPSFKVLKKSAFSERYFKTINEMVKSGSDYIVACDYDNEGSLIGYNILRFIFKENDAKRMFFSTLTKQDLVNSYEKIMAHLDWQNITAGETRHFLDWLYGVNTTRALTLAIKKNSKRFSILSAGRVQGPTLTLLAERELEIKKFVPTPYWQIQLTLLIDGNEVIALYENEKLWNREEAEKIFKECKGKPAIVEDVSKRRYKQSPPAPFNITSLQTEAYRLFGYSPQQTLNIAQALYTNAYVSYPRTSSEKLPPQIGYRQILEALSRIKKYESLCKSLLSLPALNPVEGNRTDPAHEAIHPTVEPPKDVSNLRSSEQKIYDLICRRFFSVFAKEAIRESIQLLIKINGHKFLATGRRTIEKGWMEFYGPYARVGEIVLPDLKKGDKLDIKKLELLDKETAPPPRYSQASIIKEMEKRGLGTRATRAAILQTLYDRDYAVDKSVRVTDLGLKVASALKKYVPDFVDEKLTKKFEKDIERIMEGKEKEEKVLKNAENAIVKICDEFKEHEDKIGKELGEAIIQTQNDKAVVGQCKSCGGTLKILFSPFSRKMFVGCTGYSKCKLCGFSKGACKCKCPICGMEKGKCKCSWKDKKWNPFCQTGYPLPHGASFQRLDKVCEKCNTPMIQVIRKGKRPFRMCLDPKCETKADWGKPKKILKKTKKSNQKV